MLHCSVAFRVRFFPSRPVGIVAIFIFLSPRSVCRVAFVAVGFPVFGIPAGNLESVFFLVGDSVSLGIQSVIFPKPER